MGGALAFRGAMRTHAHRFDVKDSTMLLSGKRFPNRFGQTETRNFTEANMSLNISVSLGPLKKLLILTIPLALLCASSAYAATGGTISGTVKGPDGHPFRAAFIRAENLSTKMSMTVLSDKDGKFYTDKLAPGTYRLRATTLGYKGDAASSVDVTVEDGKDVPHNFTMQKTPVLWSQLTMYQAGTLIPDAPGKGVFLQQCFTCHAFGKIGAVGRRDQDGWKDALETHAASKSFRRAACRGKDSHRISGQRPGAGFQDAIVSRAIARVSEDQAGARLL